MRVRGTALLSGPSRAISAPAVDDAGALRRSGRIRTEITVAVSTGGPERRFTRVIRVLPGTGREVSP